MSPKKQKNLVEVDITSESITEAALAAIEDARALGQKEVYLAVTPNFLMDVADRLLVLENMEEDLFDAAYDDETHAPADDSDLN